MKGGNERVIAGIDQEEEICRIEDKKPWKVRSARGNQ